MTASETRPITADELTMVRALKTLSVRHRERLGIPGARWRLRALREDVVTEADAQLIAEAFAALVGLYRLERNDGVDRHGYRPHEFAEKSVICLQMAALPKRCIQWQALWDAGVTRFGAKAMERRFDRLALRGYIEYGVSARTGWLTPKGRAALDRIPL